MVQEKNGHVGFDMKCGVEQWLDLVAVRRVNPGAVEKKQGRHSRIPEHRSDVQWSSAAAIFDEHRGTGVDHHFNGLDVATYHCQVHRGSSWEGSPTDW